VADAGRVIAGSAGGVRLTAPGPGTRPFTDRVKQTLFAILEPDLEGAVVLDLFAGSGALGVEALSRGAREVVLVERDPASARAIGDLLAQLRCDRGHVEQVDALAWLERGPPASRPFDIVFLDPPYGEAWLPVLAEKLERGGWLAPGAWIYLEDAAARGEPALPPS